MRSRMPQARMPQDIIPIRNIHYIARITGEWRMSSWKASESIQKELNQLVSYSLGDAAALLSFALDLASGSETAISNMFSNILKWRDSSSNNYSVLWFVVLCLCDLHLPVWSGLVLSVWLTHIFVTCSKCSRQVQNSLYSTSELFE